MSDDNTAASPPAKKGGGMKKLLLFVVMPLVLVGGGVGGGLFAAGKMGGKESKHEDPNRPKLVLKGGEHGAPATHDGPEPAQPNPEIYKSTYYPIELPFTSNLRDTDGFLQVGIGVSTFYDSKVIDHLKESEMPVRSAVLETLAQQEAEFINTPQGKVALRKALKVAINNVLERREGFGGVDDVYFTSFIIQ
jgi:flagellar FliL protein